ncbi:outer membrane protein assembly factor BamE, partial [Mycobacterium tuberculosis]
IGLAACDSKNISELEEGVSTEADVRARFGQPENVWDAPNGGRVFEYNRQPAGQKNYMITIGPDGKMSALRQVLTPENFAKVQPGMMM